MAIRLCLKEMFHHHLHNLISHAASLARDVPTYFRATGRGLVASLTRFDSPLSAFQNAMRRGDFSHKNARPVQPIRGTPILIHYHIFKNAGTSFEGALEQVFGSGLRRYDTPRHDGFLAPRDIAQYVKVNPEAKVIITHQAAPPAPRINGRQPIASILIRDPMARIRSIYAFERTQPLNDPGPVKARELDFRDYVQWRLRVSPRMFCNFQVHFCSRKRAKGDPSIGRAELDQAIAALDRTQIVGTVERYDEWLALSQSVLADSFGPITLRSARENQTSKGRVYSEAKILEQLVDELGPKLAKLLLERNELDMSLHQVADALLTRRLAERSVALRLRDAYGSVNLFPNPQPPISEV